MLTRCRLNTLLIATAMVSPVTLVANPVLRFVFESGYAGIDGDFAFQYCGNVRSGADIEGRLRFHNFDNAALKALDGNCTTDKVTEFAWHIHTKWTQPQQHTAGSAQFASVAQPPVDLPTCQSKVKDYKCTTDEYKKNFAACESGDLSGKCGNIKLDDRGEFNVGYMDLRFPFAKDATKDWIIVIHAVDEYGANEETVISVGKLHVRVHAHEDDN